MKNYMLYFLFILCFTVILPILPNAIPKSLLPAFNDESFNISNDESSKIESAIKRVDVMLENGNIKSMDLEDYVKGVMYAELPQDMPPEYYKAMAVAVRTYAVYHAANGDKRSSHLDCDLCCDISHCRAFDYNKTTEAINSAVKITRGELILYNKNPINAVFHISSSVRTESAFEVFGKDIPYLVSVDSKNEETVNGFYGKKELSSNEFLAIMAQNGYILNGKFNDWITYISYTAGGRIKNISVCGYNISGVDFAKMFGLQSANISVKTGSGGFVLETEGIGHGVGLSQYGAYVMSTENYTYKQILTHYFVGTYIG